MLQGVTHGAVDFLIKPVRQEELRNVWQHVVRRKLQVLWPGPLSALRLDIKYYVSGGVALSISHLFRLASQKSM